MSRFNEGQGVIGSGRAAAAGHDSITHTAFGMH